MQMIQIDICRSYNNTEQKQNRAESVRRNSGPITFPTRRSSCPCRSSRSRPLVGCPAVSPPLSEPCWPRLCRSPPPSPASSPGPCTLGFLVSPTAAPPHELSIPSHRGETHRGKRFISIKMSTCHRYRRQRGVQR